MPIRILIAIVLLVVLSIDVEAQCSMCRAVAESSIDGGGRMGKGLNSGIMYLMGIPYLILIGGALYFFGGPLKEKLFGR